jgi:hypothetical protein
LVTAAATVEGPARPADAAAAVVLDVNKQVAYARDRRGRIVGRQVLAIDERDELLCFEVYPQPDPPRVAAFRAFDAALAGALGLPRRAHDAPELQLPCLLAQSFYVEALWDDEAD